MKGPVLLDTGPLLAFLVAGLDHHAWACAQWRRLHPPLLTCEPVLTEAAFLLKREGCDPDPVFELVARGVVRVGLQVEPQLADLRALMRRYRDRPMSLADACLVRLAELLDDHRVCTLDSDFTVYRKHGKKPVPLVIPS